MALIWRCMLETEPEAADVVAGITTDWLREKLGDDAFELPDPNSSVACAEAWEVDYRSDENALGRGVRIRLYERREEGQEEVTTTVTALPAETSTLVWVDVDRWHVNPYDPPWVPAAPRVVNAILRGLKCRVGPSPMAPRALVAQGEVGARLADEIGHRDRRVPLVVVSPTAEELASSLAPAVERGNEIHRRLAGIAKVVVLGRSAVTDYSQAALARFGSDWDVAGGAVRVYYPGVSDARGQRVLAWNRLAGRRSETAAFAIAPVIQRRACAMQPPAIWRDEWRDKFATPGADDDAEELLRQADIQRRELEDRLDAVEEQLVHERDQAALSERLADEQRALANYYRRKLEAANVTDIYDPPVAFVPEDCADAVLQALEALPGVVLADVAAEGAEGLDSHGRPRWAGLLWKALRAFDNYVSAVDNGFRGSFYDFCGQAGDDGFPPSKVALKESDSTMSSGRLRGLRVFAVDPAVGRGLEPLADDGRAVMESHVKLDPSPPAPRIYFIDDATGATGKVHVGYIGPHLDNRSTN
jgi:hypothetical protein